MSLATVVPLWGLVLLCPPTDTSEAKNERGCWAAPHALSTVYYPDVPEVG
jgi:hypothetical protein